MSFSVFRYGFSCLGPGVGLGIRGSSLCLLFHRMSNRCTGRSVLIEYGTTVVSHTAVDALHDLELHKTQSKAHAKATPKPDQDRVHHQLKSSSKVSVDRVDT
jgi:hypothetical protein